MMIMSRQNPLIKQYRAALSQKSGVFSVESGKLVGEALSAGFIPQSALFTAKAAEKHGALSARLAEFCAVTGISADISEYISDTKTPQGVHALFRRKDCGNNLPDLAEAARRNKRFMLLDGVRDPGNAGAVMRSCEAFGFGGVVFSEDCADVFHPKVIRASAGSAFRLPAYRNGLTEAVGLLKEAGFTVYASGLNKNALPLKEAAFADKSAVVVGSEGRGVSAEVLNACDETLYIPIIGAESLNASVAAGIICYAAGIIETAK